MNVIEDFDDSATRVFGRCGSVPDVILDFYANPNFFAGITYRIIGAITRVLRLPLIIFNIPFEN